MMIFMLKRKIPWEESVSIPFAFALYFIGFPLFVLPCSQQIDHEIEAGQPLGGYCLQLRGGHRRRMGDKSVQTGREALDLAASWPAATLAPPASWAAATRLSRFCAPATARVPGWSCPGPYRRPDRRPGPA